MFNFKKNYRVFSAALLSIWLISCSEEWVVVEQFETRNSLSTAILALADIGIESKISEQRDTFELLVAKDNYIDSISLLINKKIVYEEFDVSSMLEQKFGSLSKFEQLKSNIVEEKKLQNALMSLPQIQNVSIIIDSQEQRNKDTKAVISVLIQLRDGQLFTEADKESLENFIKGSKADLNIDSVNIAYL